MLLWLGGHSLVALIAGIILLDVGSQGMHITNQSEIYRLRPEARSRINSFYMTCYFIGGALGSAASAFTYARWHWSGVCVLGALIAVATGLRWATENAGRRTVESVVADR